MLAGAARVGVRGAGRQRMSDSTIPTDHSTVHVEQKSIARIAALGNLHALPHPGRRRDAIVQSAQPESILPGRACAVHPRTLAARTLPVITAIVVILLFLIPIIIYVLVVLMEVPGLAEERLGRLEPLPADHDQWKTDRETAAGKAALERGLERETRLYSQPGGLLNRERLVLQSRYRNPNTDEIEGADPDVPYRRRRVKNAGS